MFKNLVSNQYMEEFDYANRKFGFKTVFYKSTFYQCYCRCPFEHEYMDYVSENGEVNEEIYEKIIQNIIDGMCPHVDQAPDDYVKETSISGLHVAACLGTVTAIKRHLDHSQGTKSTIFQLEPSDMAYMKNKIRTLHAYHYHNATFKDFRSTVRGDTRVPYTTKPNHDSERIEINKLYPLEWHALNRDIKSIKYLLGMPFLTRNGFVEAYTLTMKLNLKDEQSCLFDYIETELSRSDVSSQFVYSCVEAAIMYNEHEELNRILMCLNKPLVDYEHCKDKIRTLFTLIKESECENVLSRNGVVPCRWVSCARTYTRQKLLDLIDKSYDIKSQMDQLFSTFRRVYAEDVANICDHIFTKPTNAETVRAFLELYAKYRLFDERYSSITSQILSIRNSCARPVREAIEWIINANPDVDRQRDVVNLGLRYDVVLQSSGDISADISGSYETDAKVHGLFGHDGGNLAFNFMGPLLIESGFMFTREILRKFTDKYLHPSELDYLADCLNNPRSLLASCRDVLRREYKGQMIHKFVHISEGPKKIKDAILLKHLLRCIY